MAKFQLKKELKLQLIFFAVIGFIFGYMSHIAISAYDKHVNRPILSFKILSMTINETLNGGSFLKVVLGQENTGESEAMYTIKACDALFPRVNSKPLKMKVNKFLSLNGRSFRVDTISIPITFALENIDIMKFDSLNFIELNILETRLKKTYIVKRNAAEVSLRGGLSNGGPAKYSTNNYFGIKDNKTGIVDTLDPNLVQYAKQNPKTGDYILIRGIHNIFYNGNNYTNYFFPSTAKVAHTIVNDKIYIECSLPINVKGIPSPGFHFMPDNRLKGKIVLPKYYSLFSTMEFSTDEGIMYNNLRMDLEKNDYGIILCFLFID